MKHWILKITTMICMGIIALLGLGACKSAKSLENEGNGKEKVKPIDRDPGRVKLMYGVRPTPYSTKIQEEKE